MVLLLVLFCPCGDLDVLFVEDTHYPSSDFMMDNGLVILANDVDAKFLEEGKK